MNTAHDEQLKQIRARQEERRARCERVVRGTEIPMPPSIADIDLLLSLLATARRETYQDAMRIAQTAEPQYKNQSSLREAIVDGLEAAKNRAQPK